MRISPLLLLSLAALPCAAGNVYKWIDAEGQVHYSQTPPPTGPVTIQRQGALQPSVISPPAPVLPAESPAKNKPPESTQAAVETAAEKAKRCAAARERLAFLEERTARRLMIEQADGSAARMTEEQFAERVAKAREAGQGC